MIDGPLCIPLQKLLRIVFHSAALARLAQADLSVTVRNIHNISVVPKYRRQNSISTKYKVFVVKNLETLQFF